MTTLPHRLSPRQASILRTVRAHPGLTHPEITCACKRRFYLRDVGDTLRDLEHLGLVRSRPMPRGSRAALQYFPAGRS